MGYLSSQKLVPLKFLLVNNRKWHFLNTGREQKSGPLLIAVKAVQAMCCTTPEDAIYIDHNVTGVS